MFWVLIDPFWSNKTFRYHFTADRDYFLLSWSQRCGEWLSLWLWTSWMTPGGGERRERRGAGPGIIKWMRQSQEPFPVPMEYDPGPGCPGVILSLQWPMMSRGDLSWSWWDVGPVTMCHPAIIIWCQLCISWLPLSRHHTELEKLMTPDTGLWGRVIGLGSCHANRRYRVRGEAVSCGEPRLWRRGCWGEADRWTQAWIIINGPIQLNVEHYLHIH